MLTSATIGAVLVLLVILSEAGSGFLWRDTESAPRFYCPACDLRYARFEVQGRFVRICPHGHATARVHAFGMTTAVLTACVTFIVFGAIMVGLGLLH